MNVSKKQSYIINMSANTKRKEKQSGLLYPQTD